MIIVSCCTLFFAPLDIGDARCFSWSKVRCCLQLHSLPSLSAGVFNCCMIEVFAPLPLLQIVHLSLSLVHLDFVLFDSVYRLVPLIGSSGALAWSVLFCPLQLRTVFTLLVFAPLDIGDACCVSCIICSCCVLSLFVRYGRFFLDCAHECIGSCLTILLI